MSRRDLRWVSSTSNRMSVSGAVPIKQCEKECVALMGRPGPRKRSGRVKTGRRQVEPSDERVILEASDEQVAETPVGQLQDLVNRTAPSNLGSLGWMRRVTRALAN